MRWVKECRRYYFTQRVPKHDDTNEQQYRKYKKKKKKDTENYLGYYSQKEMITLSRLHE